ncbi:MAG: hypothetical protein WCA22_00380 [Candidatus Binatus sp.]
MSSALYSEQTCFEADRRALVRQLKAVGNAIEDGASEMAMIAAENVFDEQVSKVLTREARAMYRMVRGLKDLRLAVARARLPRREISAAGRSSLVADARKAG